MTRTRSYIVAVAAACTAVAGLSSAVHGCAGREGCLSGDDGSCLPAVPCATLQFSCDDPSLELGVMSGAAGERPPGLDALAASGDVRIGNSRVLAILDAIGSPHHLSPSGGSILDLVPRRGGETTAAGGDELNQALQAVGILPDDAARYHTLQLLDRRPEYVAVIARGRLDGRPDVDIVTRYEVRPCEPGVRVRTELFHGARDPMTYFLSDAYYWGGREITPFVPLRGHGFLHPELDLAELGEAYRDVPFFAAQGHTPGAASYAVIACDRDTMEAFQSTSVSAAGRERTILMTGDGIAFERFVAVAEGPGLAGAAGIALETRGKLRGERSAIVSGRVVGPAGDPVGGDERLVSLLFYEPAKGSAPDDPSGRLPWSEAVPDADGRFSVRLPAGRSYRVEPHTLGRPVPAQASFTIGSSDMEIPDVVVPAAGVLDARIVDSDGAAVLGEIVLTPASPTTAAEVRGSVYGEFDEDPCAPFLGPPHGASPACNRALVDADGSVSLAVPAGSFWVYGTRGPFATIARERVTIAPGETTSIELVVDALDGLVPAGVLSADFHVHAGASFDSSLPERDRARSFAASGIDVIAATDHDVVTTYAQAIADLGLSDRVVVMPGVETTGQILFHRPPGSEIPQVIGHYNFWPLRADTRLARNGSPWDELVEPGALFDRIEPAFSSQGVRQLNHPFAGSSFGRDEGYLSAIDYDPRIAVPAAPADTPEGQLPRRPGGGLSNLDHHVQEVMNGASTEAFVKYRTAWHSFLNQGILRGGTANSDSHTLAVEVLGYPRNLVFGGHELATFNVEAFNAAVRAGAMIGTNGPIILACVDSSDLGCREPSLSPVPPAPGGSVRIEVRAAPWIAVEEIRVIVNGRLAHVIGAAEIAVPADPFGKEGLLRFDGTVPLEALLAGVPPGADAWIVVEAGVPLPLHGDIDDDGVPETTDNDGDGDVDPADEIGRDDDERWNEPPMPGEDDPHLHHWVIGAGAWATAFTNPMLIDRGADGWKAPGL